MFKIQSKRLIQTYIGKLKVLATYTGKVKVLTTQQARQLETFCFE